MVKIDEIRGACLCGAVTICVNGDLEHEAEACHCSQCRKHSGHFLAAVNVRKTALSVQGKDAVSWYSSSAQVKRGFCKHCGSTLFWQPVMEDYLWTSVAMGLFDQSTGVSLSKHTFVADKGDYYEITDGLPCSDGY